MEFIIQLDDIMNLYRTNKNVFNDKRDFEQYLRDKYVQVYDDQLKFIGWERK